MEYCDIIWDNCYESESSLLEDIQLHGLYRKTAKSIFSFISHLWNDLDGNVRETQQ